MLIHADKHADYRERNLHVATAYGLIARLEKSFQRAAKNRRMPMWVACDLEDALRRARKLLPPLIEHRNEAPDRPENGE